MSEPETSTEERPAWLPENFRDGEALAASYVESQRKITDLSNSLKASRSQVALLENELADARANAGKAQTLGGTAAPLSIEEQAAFLVASVNRSEDTQ